MNKQLSYFLTLNVSTQVMPSGVPYDESIVATGPVYASFWYTGEMERGDDKDINGTCTEVAGSRDIRTNTKGLFTVHTTGTSGV